MLHVNATGKQIVAARLAAGMSQVQLARAIGSTEKNISRWENDQNQPRLASIVAIASATGHDIDFFLTGSTEDEDDEEEDAMAALTRAVEAVVRKTLNKELEAQGS